MCDEYILPHLCRFVNKAWEFDKNIIIIIIIIIALVSLIKSVVVRKRRRTFGTHKPKAPSGRELTTKSGEGERVTIELVQIQSYAGSFRHASRATFLPEEGYFSARQYT